MTLRDANGMHLPLAYDKIKRPWKLIDRGSTEKGKKKLL
jgi:hypothetical protein